MYSNKDLYHFPSAMEPLLPEDKSGELDNIAADLIRSVGSLSNSANSITRIAVAELLRPTNSYYSNLIEGHDTHPLDIERALKSDFSNDKKNRNLQLEAKAHITLHREVSREWRGNTSEFKNPYQLGYILNLHKRFYDQLPNEFLEVKSHTGDSIQVLPGKIRTEEVKVSNHIAPAASSVGQFMSRFENGYNTELEANNTLIKRVINIAASHHRLAWIHPFLDGNGRVVRLFSDACFLYEELDAAGIWSISRGLARNNEAYYSHLANADMKRHGDYDGRGNLSNKMLVEFCKFFLTTALDQIHYMKECLEIDKMIHRIKAFVSQMSIRKGWRIEMSYLLVDIYVKGKITKSDAMRITNTSDKTLKLMTDMLAFEELIAPKKEGKEMTYHANFPIKYSPLLFPRLFPANKESDLLTRIFT